MRTKLDFVRQQGFAIGTEDLYVPLMFQPRVIAAVMGTGIAVQNPWIFLALGTALSWSVSVPSRNPFDAVYRRLAATRTSAAQAVLRAPAPRRFAQALAGTCSLAIAAALFLGAARTAWALEAMLAAAVIAIMVGRFCAGSYIYDRLIVRRGSARARGEGCRVSAC